MALGSGPLENNGSENERSETFLENIFSPEKGSLRPFGTEEDSGCGAHKNGLRAGKAEDGKHTKQPAGKAEGKSSHNPLQEGKSFGVCTAILGEGSVASWLPKAGYSMGG